MLVLEWAVQHLEELIADWDLCRTGQPPKSIKGLK